MESQPVIESVQPEERALVLRWDDEHVSRFHHIWLRDNCTCDECGTTETGTRFLQLLDIPEDVSPEHTELDHGSLVIRWGPDGHQSRYESSFLRRYCYSVDGLSKGRRPWGAEITDSLTPPQVCTSRQ